MAKINKAQLNDIADDWISDRIINNDPLLLNAFIGFMKDLGRSKAEIAYWNAPAYRDRMKDKFLALRKR